MNELFVCKSISLANYLLKNDCKLIKIDKDQKNRNFLVFLFYKNSDLKSALDSWKPN